MNTGVCETHTYVTTVTYDSRYAETVSGTSTSTAGTFTYRESAALTYAADVVGKETYVGLDGESHVDYTFSDTVELVENTRSAGEYTVTDGTPE